MTEPRTPSARLRVGDMVEWDPTAEINRGVRSALHPEPRQIASITEGPDGGEVRFAGDQSHVFHYGNRFRLVRQSAVETSHETTGNCRDRTCEAGRYLTQRVQILEISAQAHVKRANEAERKANAWSDEIGTIANERDRLQRRCDALELQMRRAGIEPKGDAQ